MTPLILAAAQGEDPIVEALLAAGADPRRHGPQGWTTPIQHAVGRGDRRMVEALLRRDPGLRLGSGPRVWMIEGMARLSGHADLLRQVEGGER